MNALLAAARAASASRRAAHVDLLGVLGVGGRAEQVARPLDAGPRRRARRSSSASGRRPSSALARRRSRRARRGRGPASSVTGREDPDDREPVVAEPDVRTPRAVDAEPPRRDRAEHDGRVARRWRRSRKRPLAQRRAERARQVGVGGLDGDAAGLGLVDRVGAADGRVDRPVAADAWSTGADAPRPSPGADSGSLASSPGTSARARPSSRLVPSRSSCGEQVGLARLARCRARRPSTRSRSRRRAPRAPRAAGASAARTRRRAGRRRAAAGWAAACVGAVTPDAVALVELDRAVADVHPARERGGDLAVVGDHDDRRAVGVAARAAARRSRRRSASRGCRWARRRTRSTGAPTSARAIATRWRSPPESWSGRWREPVAEADALERSRRAARRSARAARPCRAARGDVVDGAAARRRRKNCWKTKPMWRARSAARRRSDSSRDVVARRPARRPRVGRSSVPMMWSRVDLPEPDGPTTASNSPSSTIRPTPRRASTPPG